MPTTAMHNSELRCLSEWGNTQTLTRHGSQCPVSCCVQPDACLSVVLAGVAMMQIVGAPCVKAGPSANGKHPAARLSDPQ